ncbi:helix-turn-helix domain-containing protein [Rhodococcus sp. IEGM 248]|nr:helix-turn-helix domain-containing protein [Rhodococcus sp. IEGM 248]
MNNNQELLTVRDLADHFAIPESSQRLFRQQGRFIPYYMVGRRIMYRRDDLEAWLSQQLEGDRRGDTGDANVVLFTPQQMARLRDVLATVAGLNREQVDCLTEALTVYAAVTITEAAVSGGRP